MFQQLIKQGKIFVDGYSVHESSKINDNSFHAKWCEKTGLIICPDDIESIEIKLKDSSKEI